jgi:cysteine desulfurase
MLPYLTTAQGNASSDHAAGRVARAAVAKARAQVAQLIGAQPDEVIFTSGATESSNLAIYGSAKASSRRHVVTTPIEHIATLAPCRDLAQRGYELSLLDVDATGCLSTSSLPKVIRDDTLLVSVMHANNETGSIQDIRAVSRCARPNGALVHCDAAQSVGKIPVDVHALDVDLLSIAGHKLYAPKGVGALYVRRGTPLAPFALGGSQEGGLRPGTENVAFIAALGQACADAEPRLKDDPSRLQALRDRLHRRLTSALPELRLFGHPTDRLPNTLTIGFPGLSGHEVLARAPDVVASCSAACHAGSVAPSHVLTAMGASPAEARQMIRLSLGRHTTPEEIDAASIALVQAVEDATR